MAMAVLIIGTLGFGRVVVETAAVSQTQNQVDQARAAAASMLETLQQAELDEVYALFNAGTADDPGGAGTAPGRSFDVDGLQPVDDDLDGRVGEVVFPTDDDGAGGEVLREDLDLPQLGLPLDLNADGVIDGDDRSSDYALLPVLVRVRWRSPGGPAQVEMRTLLAGY